MKFEWTIENFSTLDSTNRARIESEPFFSHQGKCKWSLCLYPNGSRKEDEGYVSLYLKLSQSPPEMKIFRTVFDLCIIKDKDQMVFSKGVCVFDENKYIELFPAGLVGIGKFVSRSDILDPTKGYLSGDKLVVAAVGITFLNMVGHNKTPFVVADNMEFLNTGKFSDFKIVDANGKLSNSKETPVHKIVLAKHSSVFAGMFESGMKEALEGQVTIDGFGSEVISKLLIFLYSGKFEINNEDVKKKKDIIGFIKEIIKAGDFYEIILLKEICGQILIDNITCETAISYMVFAHTYRCPEMKELAMDFIDKNKKDLIETEEWIELFRKEPELARELTLKMLKLKAPTQRGTKRKAEDDSQ